MSTPHRTTRVAIIGSGPAGYTAEGLGIAVPVGAGIGCLLGTIVGEALDNRTPAPPKAPAADGEE